MLQGYNESRLKSSFANSSVVIMTLFAITNYHWSICWMICFIQFFRQSFPYWLWRRVIPYTWFRQSAHGGCDRSAEDAYPSVAHDPTFAYVAGPCCRIHSILLLPFDWLINYLQFYAQLKNFSFIWTRHHWRAAKFRPMLGAQGIWAGWILYRATPAVTQGLGFSDII
jgi:hypothetical protein